jgi:chromosome segregation ATPase
MTISEIQLYELLASKIGRTEAQGLVEFVETKVDKKMDEKTNTLATKEDIQYLKEDISNVKQEISNVKQDISNVKQDISYLKQEVFSVKTDMADLKVDVIKWVVGTGIALAGVMVALMVGLIQYIGN